MICPIKSFNFNGVDYEVPIVKELGSGKVANEIYNTLMNIMVI